MTMTMTADERAQLAAEVAAALKEAELSNCLSEEEQQWVRLAIQKEAQSIALRQAVIEKTLAGLVWSGLVGVGYLIVDFMKNHGLK